MPPAERVGTWENLRGLPNLAPNCDRGKLAKSEGRQKGDLASDLANVKFNLRVSHMVCRNAELRDHEGGGVRA